VEPTQYLSQDHRTIERLLETLEQAARRLYKGEPIRPGFFLDAARFISGFADGCHHRKEEGALFPAMEQAGFPSQGGPIAVMLAEHEQARRLTAVLRESAQKLAAGDAAAKNKLVDSAHGYVGLLRQHIMKEDNILFRMAQSALDADRQKELMTEFDRLERAEGPGARDNYLALLDALERELKR
jgi:hemerythrin-like domain-containing protein